MNLRALIVEKLWPKKQRVVVGRATLVVTFDDDREATYHFDGTVMDMPTRFGGRAILTGEDRAMNYVRGDWPIHAGFVGAADLWYPRRRVAKYVVSNDPSYTIEA